MKLAVIVVNYNDIDDTQRYIKTISKYEAIDRILVVDNKSSIPENTLSILKELENDKIKVIQTEKNGGYTYGNNVGIEYLREKGGQYDYIAISNPDIEISKEAIEKCLEFLETERKVAIVAPRMLNGNNEPIRRSAWKYRTFKRDLVHSSRILEILFYKTLRKGEYSEKDFKNPKLKVEVISGAFFIIRTEVLDKIQKFDDNVFLFYEEDILAKQVKDSGYEIYSLNDINFKHYESQTIGKTFSYFKKMKELHKSKMYYHKTYTKINKCQVLIFKCLRVIRIIELLVEVPMRKILGK